MLRTGAHSRSGASRRRSNARVVLVLKRSRNVRRHSGVCELRLPVEKRGSCDRSGRSSAVQMSLQRVRLERADHHERTVGVSNTPVSGIAAQLTWRPRIMIIAASCICIASIEL